MAAVLRYVGHALLLAGVLGGFASGEELRGGETRRLTLERRGDWARLFYQIRGRYDNHDVRGRLAAEYIAAGYSGAGQFFRHRPGRNEPADLVREPSNWTTSVWRCSGDPTAISRIRGVAAKISESVRTGRYDRALNEAAAALKAFGPRCELLVEWADVVLHAAMVKGDRGSADSEAAVRLLLTGVEDLNVEPGALELEGPTGVYEFLSQYFCAADDLVSCATALDFATARLSRVPAAKAEEIDQWRARLEERRNSVLDQLQPHR